MPRTQASRHAPDRDCSNLLHRAEELLTALGLRFETRAGKLVELRERLAEGRFHLAVLGQFKRGKSTLLNALLGEEVLPTAVVPLTAIPTFIEHGATCQATAYFQDGEREPASATGSTEDIQQFLSGYVTEEGNPENRKGVSHVRLLHPAPILRNGLVLIDTPGIGSTFRHNTEVTLNFLPQCDAALFLVSADPPITEIEVEFLSQARKKVSRLFFVLNKVDYLSAEERRQATEFLRTVLEQRAGMGPDVPILAVSAKRGLAARLAEDEAAWRASGMEEVERHLVEFLAAEKTRVLQEAITKKGLDILADVSMQLQLWIRSLQMPLEDLQERMVVFEEKIREVEQERQQATDLLAGDRRRMFGHLEELAARLREDAEKHLARRVEELFDSTPNEEITDERVRALLAEAIPQYFERQTGVLTDEVSKRVAKVLGVHQERADRLIESIRRTAADLFDISYRAPEADGAFRLVSRPYWVAHRWSTTLSPIPRGWFDGFLSAERRRKRILRRVYDQLESLVNQNAENLRWALYQSINETFRQFGARLDERLAAARQGTLGAIRAALDQRRQQSDVVSRQVSRLKAILEELEAVERALRRSLEGGRVSPHEPDTETRVSQQSASGVRHSKRRSAGSPECSGGPHVPEP